MTISSLPATRTKNWRLPRGFWESIICACAYGTTAVWVIAAGSVLVGWSDDAKHRSLDRVGLIISLLIALLSLAITIWHSCCAYSIRNHREIPLARAEEYRLFQEKNTHQTIMTIGLFLIIVASGIIGPDGAETALYKADMRVTIYGFLLGFTLISAIQSLYAALPKYREFRERPQRSRLILSRCKKKWELTEEKTRSLNIEKGAVGSEFVITTSRGEQIRIVIQEKRRGKSRLVPAQPRS